eukprot:364090-Chlamydomonas_euryale.AAC.3
MSTHTPLAPTGGVAFRYRPKARLGVATHPPLPGPISNPPPLPAIPLGADRRRRLPLRRPLQGAPWRRA